MRTKLLVFMTSVFEQGAGVAVQGSVTLFQPSGYFFLS